MAVRLSEMEAAAFKEEVVRCRDESVVGRVLG
jgi:hypothetical protein